MTNPIQTYVASAGQTEFAIPFKYLSEAHLRVSLRDSLVLDWSLLDAFTVSLGGSLVVNEGDVVELRRVTPRDNLLTSFASPSTLRASELQKLGEQLLFIQQEIGAESTGALKKNLAQNAWEGESLVLKNLGPAVDPSDAVTLQDLINRLATGGVLPEPVEADFGKGIRIRAAGGGGYGYSIANVNGAMTYFRIPTQFVGDPPQLEQGPAGGYDISNSNVGLLNWASLPATVVPLEIETTFQEPDGGAISIDGNDIIIPRGVFEITVEGNVRNLTTATGDPNFQQVSAALTDDTGATVYDSTPFISLGAGGGSTFPFQSSAPVRMRAVVEALLGPQRVNLRLSSTITAERVIADTPFRVIVKEMPL